MKRIFLLAAVAALNADAYAGQAAAPANPPSGTYQICLWPNPCAGEPRAAQPKTPPAKDETTRPIALIPGDPLTQAVIQGTISQGEDGIVSSIRLDQRHTGTAREQIITRGTGLRDALAPAGGAALPASRVPPSKKGAKKPADAEWVRVDVPGATAGQLNDMRTERRALTGGRETSHRAAGRMWKDKKK
ncbi:MAG: hypothetical protein HYZ75_14150 [Elusimicrobia bacterium]|nr:hypothetical protein [Elusimicrobiota bacterium]